MNKGLLRPIFHIGFLSLVIAPLVLSAIPVRVSAVGPWSTIHIRADNKTNVDMEFVFWVYGGHKAGPFCVKPGQERKQDMPNGDRVKIEVAVRDGLDCKGTTIGAYYWEQPNKDIRYLHATTSGFVNKSSRSVGFDFRVDGEP
jgi:hypothetical protein